MNRVKVVELLDRIPRICRHDRGTYREGRIAWSFNGHVKDSRSFLVRAKDGFKHSEASDWWNDNDWQRKRVDIACLEDGTIEINDTYGWNISKEAFFNLMPDDVKEELLFELDALL
jgi:hypothetical protein